MTSAHGPKRWPDLLAAATGVVVLAVVDLAIWFYSGFGPASAAGCHPDGGPPVCTAGGRAAFEDRLVASNACLALASLLTVALAVRAALRGRTAMWWPLLGLLFSGVAAVCVQRAAFDTYT